MQTEKMVFKDLIHSDQKALAVTEGTFHLKVDAFPHVDLCTVLTFRYL